MAMVWIKDVSISFGGPTLLDEAALQIEPGERIGLLGRNGSGKSTFMKMLTRELLPDKGEILKNGEIRISMLPQDVPDDLPGSVYDVVAAGGHEHKALLTEFHTITMDLTLESSPHLLKRLEQLQHQMEASGAWLHHQLIETVLTKTDLDGNAAFSSLSAGLKRRVFLARALVGRPDLLLLDEPTNHLDIDSILWLEEFLLHFDRTIMFVTHDREFLRKLATRIVEIDRGRLFSFSCGYETYLERRQSMLDAELKQRKDFDKKLAKEEIWVRRGLEARRTRNEGRVRALMQMRSELAQRRTRAGNVKLIIQEAEQSGRLVAEIEKISFSYGDTRIVENFSTTIMRGDKVGIIGPNGSGKTTLLKLMLGDLKPDQGSVRLGARIKIAYFDQLRGHLDGDLTVKENISGGSDQIYTGDVPRHVVGYLQDFLFTPSQIMSPVRSLSGGERNRLLLAKLFCTPSNMLVLDEPTNDLDAETLELLEDRLVEYSGTVLMVSHDRAFLNEVVTSTIVFEGPGLVQEYVGGYDDWLMQRRIHQEKSTPGSREEKQKKERPQKEKTRLSYKEVRELESLPQQIEEMEEKKRHLIDELNDPAFQVNSEARTIMDANDSLETLDKELDEAYRRWGELEDLASKYSG